MHNGQKLVLGAKSSVVFSSSLWACLWVILICDKIDFCLTAILRMAAACLLLNKCILYLLKVTDFVPQCKHCNFMYRLLRYELPVSDFLSSLSVSSFSFFGDFFSASWSSAPSGLGSSFTFFSVSPSTSPSFFSSSSSCLSSSTSSQSSFFSSSLSFPLDLLFLMLVRRTAALRKKLCFKYIRR